MEKSDLPSSPYKGLVPYTEEDALFFFGRDKERDLIISNLIASRLTVLYGASGVGKSSVLRAGVSHTLLHEASAAIAAGGRPDWLIVTFASWRDDPIKGIRDRLLSALSPFIVGGGVPSSSNRLDETLQSWSELTGCDLLIVLDQFEEFFLYHSSETAEGSFSAELARAVKRPDLRANFLISLREDALAELDAFKGRIPRLFDNYLRIQHLDYEAARSAILKPVGEFNRQLGQGQQPVRVEDELVANILEQVSAGKVVISDASQGAGTTITAATKAEIETPYLQLVLTRLWEEEMGEESRVLRAKTLSDLGNSQRIVSTHLDRVMSTLPPEEQETAAEIFRYLVTPSGTKIAYQATDLAAYSNLSVDLVSRALEDLAVGDVRVLRSVAPPVGEAQVTRYEIFHDVLAAPVLDWRRRFLTEKDSESKRHELQRLRSRAKFGLLGSGLVLFIAIIAVAYVLRNGPDAAKATPVGLDSTLGKILFSSLLTGNRDVYVMNSDGSGLANLTNNSAQDLQPAWSPDGRYIAFSSNRDGVFQIYVMEADGSNPTLLASRPLNDVEPSWSPDGRRIAYAEEGQIRAVNVVPISVTGLVRGVPEPKPLVDIGFSSAPAWSPDGSKIAFASVRGGSRDVYVMYLDGSKETRLTDSSGSYGYPAWSNDGKKIAFSSLRDNNREIYVMNADGSNVVQLTNEPAGSGADDDRPTWSANDTFIAFESKRDGRGQVSAVNVSKPDLVILVTNNATGSYTPSWSPPSVREVTAAATSTASASVQPSPTVTATPAPAPVVVSDTLPECAVSREQPMPCVRSVEVSSSTSKGQAFTLKVTAVNLGTSSDFGTVSVSLPDGAAASTDKTDKSLNTYPPGSKISRCGDYKDGACINKTFTTVQSQFSLAEKNVGPWRAEQEETFSVIIQPRADQDTVSILVRFALGSVVGDRPNFPPTSTTKDQQNFPAYEKVVRLTN